MVSNSRGFYELQRLGVAIHLAKPGRVMGRTADDRIADDQEARLAEIERALFVERAADGRQAKIKRGHYPDGGQPPYGYRVEGRGSETQFVIDEEHAATVRLIFQLFAYGDATGTVSAPEIARRPTALGLPTPGDLRKGFETTKKRAYGEWCAQSIYPLLRNSVYVGRFTNGRFFTVDGKRRHHHIGKDVVAVPAIVDESTWQAVQQRLDTGPRYGPRRRFNQYLVAKRLKCACSYNLIGTPSANQRSRGPYLSYVCGGRKGNVRRCTMRPLFVPAANPNARKAMHADHTAVKTERLAALDRERDKLYRQKVEHEQALSRLVDLYTRGSIPIELFDAKAAELRELLHLLQEAIEQNERQRQTVLGDDRSAALHIFAAEHQSKLAEAEHDFAAAAG